MYYEKHPSSDNGFIFMLPYLHNDFTFPLHVHKNYEFIFVEEGYLIAEINGFEYKLCRGDGAFILSNQPHRYITPEHSKSWTLIFSTDVIPELKNLVKKCPFSPMIRLKNPATREELLRNRDNPLRMRSMLYDLASTYCEGAAAPHLISDDSGVALKIIQYISEHFAEPLTLEKIAHSLGYNYRYISGVLNKAYKLPFPTIVNSHRVRRACAFLDDGEKSVTEISMLCGFGTIRSFNRNFKAVMGVTPKEYSRKLN